jgi:hypothetical protein
VPRAATEFEHAFARRDQEAHEFAIVLVIRHIEFAPAFYLVKICIDAIEQFPLSPII